MPTKYRPLIVGLAASGLLALGVVAACLAQAPSASPRRGTESPAVPHSILLLTDGRLLRGPVTEDDEGYTILQKGGTLRFRHKEVVKVFPTLTDVYQYKLSRIPPHDPDEQMMLARWCLQVELKIEAEERLRVVLELNPSNRNAENMLAALEAQAQRRFTRDAGVMRTEAIAPAGDGVSGGVKPNAINEIEIAKAARAMGAVGPPVIFDLPPAVAVKRYEQFVFRVQQVLLGTCAKCHNDRYQGEFKLVEIKTRRDQNHLTYKTNLDATLKLVDPVNPAQSPLLTNALIPHGPTQKPILRGPNDPSYQILATWVRSIVTPTNDLKLTPAQGFAKGVGTDQGGQEAGFGLDRPGVLPPMPSRPSTSRAGGPLPSRTDSPVDPAFPVPPLMSGSIQLPKPAKSGGGASSGAGAGSNSQAKSKSLGGAPAEIPPEMLPPDLRNAPPLPKNTATKKFSGKIDPSVLENLMKNANAGNPGG